LRGEGGKKQRDLILEVTNLSRGAVPKRTDKKTRWKFRRRIDHQTEHGDNERGVVVSILGGNSFRGGG